MVGRRLSLDLTFDDAFSYITSVKEVFHDEPAKYDEFLKVLKDLTPHRVDEDAAIARVEELMKEHRKLLLGFSVFFPANAKRIIPPDEAKQLDGSSNYTKRKCVEPDSVNFLNRVKIRFRSLDTHVVESFCEIMKSLNERKKSEKEVHKEVVDLLYYHEDLIDDFFQIVSTKLILWHQYLY